jgi:phage tail sheath protein FI
MPDTERLSDADASSVIAAATAYVVRRRAMYVVDLPQRDTARDQAGAVETWLDTHPQLRSPNAALYFPRLELADPLDRNQLRAVPASGTMAGVFARTDRTKGVWKAPAGTDAPLHGILKLERPVSDAQNDRLNALGVNCLRTFGAAGPVAWGARTLAGADALASPFKYLPVMRLALYLEESVARGTRLQPGDRNAEPLWSRVRLRVGTFLHGRFLQGAFQGGTPREAFFVKCDSDTMSGDDILNGRVNIVVGFAPLKPAEFVIIRLQQVIPPEPDDDDPLDADVARVKGP